VTAQTSSERGPGSSAAAVGGAPAHTGSRTTRVLGIITLVALALLVYLALVGTPADVVQGDAVRLIYLHVPVVMVAFLACFGCSIASGVWLWKRSQWWDLAASCCGELATVFTAATLLTGSIWGGAAWGTFWVWDARLTSTAMLFLLLLGYLAVRRIPAAAEVRARRSAIVGLLLVPNIVIINKSVEWWRSIHQGSTALDPTKAPTIADLMYFTFMYSIVVGGLVFAWLLIHRFRVAYLQDQLDEVGLTQALEDRRAEAGA
jgi:heme exporter protein C